MSEPGRVTENGGDQTAGPRLGPLQYLADQRLARVLSASDARRVYGEPVTRGDRTVVPVAEVRAWFGFGGGGGRAEGDQRGSGEGAGGGGAVSARPVGYLEVTPDGTQFVPIADVTKIAVAGCVVAGVVALLLFGRRGAGGRSRIG